MTSSDQYPDQPISTVEWIDAGELRANDYNPNKVFSPEMRLLARSIIEDGWTQPIVARVDGEIVDGFHRWAVATTVEAVRKMTGGKVPVVRLRDVDAASQRISTIRHNRARGKHGVVPMAQITTELIEEHDLSEQELMDRLGMEAEEIARLRQRGSMVERGPDDETGVSAAWVPQS